MMPVSIMRSSRRAMVRIQASRCAFIAVVSDTRLTSLPSEASVCTQPDGEEEGHGAKVGNGQLKGIEHARNHITTGMTRLARLE